MLFEALTPFGNMIGEGLLWFMENVLAPLGVWASNNLIPQAFELIAAALDVLRALIEAAKPVFLFFWEEFLVPIGEWAGEKLLQALEWVTEKLKELSKWIRENSESVTEFLTMIGLLVAAFLTVKTSISIVTTLFGGLKAIIAIIASPIGVIALIVAAIIGVITVTGNCSDMIDALKLTFKGLGDFISGVFAGDWKKAWQGIQDVFKGIFDAIVLIFKSFLDGVSILFPNFSARFAENWNSLWGRIADSFINTFGGLKTTFTDTLSFIKTTCSQILDVIVNIFSNAWSNISNAAIVSFNNIIEGINGLISALNTIKFDFPDWVPAIGGNSFGVNIPSIPKLPIPQLAKGGIVDRPTLALIGEQGREAVMPLKNNTGWLKEISSNIASMISLNINIPKFDSMPALTSPTLMVTNGHNYPNMGNTSYDNNSLDVFSDSINNALATAIIELGDRPITINFEGDGADLVRRLMPTIVDEANKMSTQRGRSVFKT